MLKNFVTFWATKLNHQTSSVSSDSSAFFVVVEKNRCIRGILAFKKPNTNGYIDIHGSVANWSSGQIFITQFRLVL